jgi:alpha-galactosidase
MERRDFLCIISGVAVAANHKVALPFAPSSLAETLRGASPRVLTNELGASTGRLDVQQHWIGNVCRPKITNRGHSSVAVREIVIAEITLRYRPDTALYGESFQMLSQTAGTLAQPADLGYSELKHYRLAQPEGASAMTGLIAFTPQSEPSAVVAFASCRRFLGRFYLKRDSLQIVVDTEGLELAPGETWELEELMVADGDRNRAFATVGKRIAANHPKGLVRPPTGWCSWYCFGARVTAKQVLDNLDVIAKSIPQLKYIQIDDGYQSAMGDWLETGSAFGGDVRNVLRAIRERGFEPAIWVAPFIAESKSQVFQKHPDWFIQDASGNPLSSDRVTFGGWRHGPWLVLDGTHPEVQQHFEQLFRTMRDEWGCTYFKLDANFWGAMHGGRFHDRKATRIEAYRRGMEAIRRGAGDGFILGCNHPIWPSFGLIDGSRSSGDIKRTWETFSKQARQTLMRNWQNGTLWWNDPDAVLLTGNLSDDEFQFHATAVYASGGMVLSGDDLTTMAPARLEMLRKLLPPAGVAARFKDDSLRIGWMQLPEVRMACAFNWNDQPQTLALQLPGRCSLTDFWSGRDLGMHSGEFLLNDMPGHSARLIKCS